MMFRTDSKGDKNIAMFLFLRTFKNIFGLDT